MNTEAAGQDPQGEQVEAEVLATDTTGEAAQDEQSLDTSSVVESESEKTEDKKPSGFARRMAKHEAELEAARLESEYWKQEAMKAAVSQKPSQTAPSKQSRLDFNSDDEWLEHRLNEEREKLKKEVSETAALESHLKKLESSYLQQVEAAKKELKDWDEVVASAQESGWQMPASAAQFCVESPVGAKIAYHYAKNEEAFEKFLQLSPTRQIAELGKLEDKLSVKAAPQIKKVSSAPAPLADTKGSGSSVPPSAQDRFKDKAVWRAWREEQRGTRKR